MRQEIIDQVTWFLLLVGGGVAGAVLGWWGVFGIALGWAVSASIDLGTKERE